MTRTSQNQTPTSSERFLRWPEVKGRVGFSRSQIYLLIKQGKFPVQIKLGGRASGWLESEVNAWIAARVAESRDCGRVAA